MKKFEAKAEATELTNEFEEAIGLNGSYSRLEAKKCAIIHVKGIIENKPLLPSTDGWYETTQDVVDEAICYWQSILTELER